MNSNIKLYQPSLEELSYRQDLLSQKETMSHRKNMMAKSDKYNPETGCIDFPKEDWKLWYQEYSNDDSEMFYAYIVNNKNEFVGDASFYKSNDGNCYDMHVLIEAKHRNKNYGTNALNQLIELAFDKYHLKEIQFFVKNTDLVSLNLCESTGFKLKKPIGTKLEMHYTKEMYEALKEKIKMLS